MSEAQAGRLREAKADRARADRSLAEAYRKSTAAYQLWCEADRRVREIEAGHGVSVPAAEFVKGTVFEEVASDEQLARPVGDRCSLSDEEIVSLRSLVADNTQKDSQLAERTVTLERVADTLEARTEALENLVSRIDRLRKGWPANVPIPSTAEARRALEKESGP